MTKAPDPGAASRGRFALLAVLGTAVLLVVVERLLSPFFDAGAGVGHDHGYYLPRLLDGYFFFRENGPFAVPWWTPSFCGGTPALPDPQSTYYSLPQGLVLLGVPPLLAIKWSLLLALASGGWGMFVLLRSCFRTPAPVALVVGICFAGNSFVVSHTMIGHLVWLPAMAFPWVAWALLVPVRARLDEVFLVVLAGALLAGAFYAGMAQGLQPFGLALLFLGAARGATDTAAGRRFARRGGAAVVWALALAAAKLVPALFYLSRFPRDRYLAPGFAEAGDLLLTWARVLFFQAGTALEAPHEMLVNASFVTERHEFEFLLSPVILLLLGAGLWGVVQRSRAGARPASRLALAVASGAFLLPLLLNLHTPAVAAFIKAVPALKSSSNLLRWWVFYVWVLPVLAGWGASSFAWPSTGWAAGGRRRGWLFAGLAGALALVWLGEHDRSYYRRQPYDPRAVTASFVAVRGGAPPPPVSDVMVELDEQGRETYSVQRNDALVAGGSSLLCYEAMFGYQLEEFPRGTLDPGPVSARREDGLNLKNPACYVYPDANDCEPGAPFAIDEAEQLGALRHRRPIAFEAPWPHHVAVGVTLLALLASAGLLGLVGVWRWRAARALRKG